MSDVSTRVWDFRVALGSPMIIFVRATAFFQEPQVADFIARIPNQ